MSRKPIAKAKSKAARPKTAKPEAVKPKATSVARKVAAARKKVARPNRATAERAAATSRRRPKISIRMYRLGVGDCFLVSLPQEDGTTYRILIDCGVHQSKSGGSALIKKVVANLKEETGGKLDVVVATHEHWDHVSGFHQAAEQFLDFKVGEVWVAWTEDSNDDLARSLKDKRTRALAALGMAESRFRLAGHEGADNKLSGLLGFFGDTTGANLQKAAAVLKKMSGDGKSIRYREPGEAPIELPGGNARIFVLGPPRDKEAIHLSDPRKGENEVYAFGAYAQDLDAIELALTGGSVAPFDSRFAIPLAGSKAIPFFQKAYWADRAEPAPKRTEPTQDWRRIDDDWLGAATSLGLKLDEDTNNTSLVMALELGPPEVDGPVHLFAADAQGGNWLSWQKVEW
ncbi:MAG: MBL fold metallo-hydrolase [Reyranella sp.]